MRRSSLLEPFLVFLLGGLLAIVWTWPMAASLGQALPFDADSSTPRGSDTHIWVWDFWWVKDALWRGVNPFFSDMIFPVRGASLGLHTHAILYGTLAAPLTAWLGAPFAVGLMLLVLFASAFAATWTLARELRASRLAAGVAAFAWVFSPYFLQKGLEHMNLTATPWPPLLCLFLLRWMRGGGVRPALGAGVALGLTALVGPLVFVLTGLFGLFVCLFRPAEGARRAELLRPWPLVTACLAAGLLALPAVIEFQSGLASAELFVERTGQLETDGLPGAAPPSWVAREVLARPGLKQFVQLPELHPLGSAELEEVDGGNEISALHISFALWILLGVALTRGPRRGLAPLAGLTCVYFFLAWDPWLPLGLGHPSGLYRRLPLLDGLRVPARFLPYFLLSLALAATRGVDQLLALPKRAVGHGALLLLVGLLVFESWTLPYPLMDLKPPAAVAALALEPALPGAENVLTLPAYMGASNTMTWQTQHGRKVILSYLARIDPWIVHALQISTPDLYALLVPKLDAAGDFVVPDAAALALDLAHLHVGVVLVDPEAFAEVEGLLEIPAELLDDMPGWSRVAQVGKLLVWHRNP